MKTISFMRHAGWVGPEDLRDTVNIIGCGAVGSNAALCLAKMGFTRFKLWDADIVESHNLPNQAYDVEHIGMPKVEALEAVLKRFNPEVTVTTFNRFFTKEEKDVVGPLLIATDTMKSRMEFGEFFTNNLDIDHVYEIRLGFDYGELNLVDPMDSDACAAWRNGLRPDEEIPEGPCNLRICTTLVGITTSYLTQVVCAKYAAERSQKPWKPAKKTIFELNPFLKIYSF